MSINSTNGKASDHAEDKASSFVSPSMTNVLPIRGVDTCTKEVLAIAQATIHGEIGDGDLSSVAPIHWTAMDVNALSWNEISGDLLDVLQSIYQLALADRRYDSLLNKHSYLMELNLMAARGQMLKAITGTSGKDHAERVATWIVQGAKQKKAIKR
ncbi:hypothetical protein Adt_35600 [Abeliophyllum distichum]|uniref:Uncharacterized protein n=1 Tax=Abeliophyllum distichum TaxID=126358 RepID=A0ABD1QIM4_9LAMI